MVSNAPPRAVILGCAGPVLLPAERDFFAAADPLGFILFGRNVVNPPQVRALCADLRETVDRPDAPILIDQEGGRVRRLRPPHWRESLAMQPFGALYARDPAAGREALSLNTQLQAAELRDLGITVNCAPVLDVPSPTAHDIIGDRAFSHDPAVVATLGQVVDTAMRGQGVLSVIKHIPGHGRAESDSHLAMPVVHADLKSLESDFIPFRALAEAPLAMTAHIVYTALDAHNVATFSPYVIAEIIRQSIGFKGLLLSDDLSMEALTGDYQQRAERAMRAGCDVVLHCNGKASEIAAVVAGTPRLADAGLARWQRACALVEGPRQAIAENAEARLADLLKTVS